jgi:hypothetical protein
LLRRLIVCDPVSIGDRLYGNSIGGTGWQCRQDPKRGGNLSHHRRRLDGIVMLSFVFINLPELAKLTTQVCGEHQTLAVPVVSWGFGLYIRSHVSAATNAWCGSCQQVRSEKVLDLVGRSWG